MKILLISTRFPPLIGGVEKVVESIYKHLSKNNDVTVISSLNLEYLYKKYGVHKMILGFKVADVDESGGVDASIRRYWLNLPRTILGYLSFPYRVMASTYLFIKDVRKLKPDVINYHFPDDSSLYVWLMTFFVDSPLVVNIHGNDLHIFSKQAPYSFFIKQILKRSSAVLVNSAYMRGEFSESFPELKDKVEIIPNGIDVEYFQNIKPKKYFSEPYIFFVGRMVQKKGVDILLRAFAKANIEGLKMLLEGHAEELEEMKRLSRELGVEDKVKFTEGKLSDNEKVAYMKAAIFGVMPSRIEPFGIVALEFLASGVPLIASKTGGLKKILEDGKTCLFFRNEDVDDLVKKIHELYGDQKLQDRLVKNGSREVQKYSEDKIAQKYLELYKKIA